MTQTTLLPATTFPTMSTTTPAPSLHIHIKHPISACYLAEEDERDTFESWATAVKLNTVRSPKLPSELKNLEERSTIFPSFLKSDNVRACVYCPFSNLRFLYLTDYTFLSGI